MYPLAGSGAWNYLRVLCIGAWRPSAPINGSVVHAFQPSATCVHTGLLRFVGSASTHRAQRNIPHLHTLGPDGNRSQGRRATYLQAGPATGSGVRQQVRCRTCGVSGRRGMGPAERQTSPCWGKQGKHRYMCLRSALHHSSGELGSRELPAPTPRGAVLRKRSCVGLETALPSRARELSVIAPCCRTDTSCRHATWIQVPR